MNWNFDVKVVREERSEDHRSAYICAEHKCLYKFESIQFYVYEAFHSKPRMAQAGKSGLPKSVGFHP